MIKLHTRWLMLPLVAALGGGAWAGTVQVDFVNPSNYTDAGVSQWDERDNMEALRRHLQSLGQKLLPAAHSVRVEVLDLDLAGTTRPVPSGPYVRVVRGTADFPRIKLRYTVQIPGQPARAAEEVLSELNYTHPAASTRRNEPLYYEKRMLEAWFRSRIAG